MVMGKVTVVLDAQACVAVIVAVTGEVPVLAATNEGIFPVPLAARPMAVLLFVHEVPYILMGEVVFPAQKV